MENERCGRSEDGWWSWLGWEVNHVKPLVTQQHLDSMCVLFFSLSHLQTTILSCLTTIQVCLKIGGTPYLWPCEIAESDDKRWGNPISQFWEAAHEGRPVHHAMNRFCWFVMDLWFVFFSTKPSSHGNGSNSGCLWGPLPCFWHKTTQPVFFCLMF